MDIYHCCLVSAGMVSLMCRMYLHCDITYRMNLSQGVLDERISSRRFSSRKGTVKSLIDGL